MTASEYLRKQASLLKHAIVHTRVIDDTGHIEGVYEYHYLTCTKCKLEKEADKLEHDESNHSRNET